MLPPFIIEQIKKREQEEKERRQRPAVRLPLPERPFPMGPEEKPSNDHENERGVIIIEV
jgi:hypothetical protein